VEGSGHWQISSVVGRSADSAPPGDVPSPRRPWQAPRTPSTPQRTARRTIRHTRARICPFTVHRMRPKTLLVTAISIVWLLALLYAFWWYQGRYLRAFDEQAVLFSGDQLQLPPALAGPGPVRLVHFWDPACPCN